MRDADLVDQRRTIPGSHPLTRLAVAYCAHAFALSGQLVMLGSLLPPLGRNRVLPDVSQLATQDYTHGRSNYRRCR